METTRTRTRTVALYASDPISRAGISAGLSAGGLAVAEEQDDADVALVVVDEITEDVNRLVRQLARASLSGIVLVVTRIDDQGLFTAVETGVNALLRRSEATPQALAEAVREVANGNAALPSDLLGRLMNQVGSLHDQVLAPQGMHLGGLSDREVDVLRLVADGHATSEIARQLCYSERTIKNVIQGVTTRLRLRNRSHAVAYALRHGLL